MSVFGRDSIVKLAHDIEVLRQAIAAGSGGGGGAAASGLADVPATIVSAGGTVNLPAVSGSSDIYIDMTGSVQVSLPTPIAGAHLFLVVRQNGGANDFLVSFNASPTMSWVGGTPARAAQGANARTAYEFRAPNSSQWLGYAQVS